jgi:quercetin dioxygenase-like cupin family protein
MALQHAKPGEVVDLRPLGPQLKQARTAAIVKSDSFEVVRLIVHAGSTIPAHEVARAIMLHCLEGRVRLGLSSSSLELSAGEWVYLEGAERHSVTGIEDASVLLTILLDR